MKWILFLPGVLLLCGVVTAQLPADAILQDSKNGVVAYKPMVGLAEKQPSDQLYIFDAAKSLSILISCTDKGVVGNAYSDSASTSRDGVLVTFHSWASNLAPAPSCANVFLKDTVKRSVKVVKDHALAPAMTPDGKYVVYEYNADPQNGLPAIYRYEVATGKEEFIDHTSLGNWKGGWYFPNPQISDDGLTVIYHTTKSGYPEVWEWRNGEITKVRDGVVVDTPIVQKEQVVVK